MPSNVIFEIISIVSFALSALLFIVAAVLFFKFNIPSVVGYLTGKTAKKKIKEMQQGSYKDKSGELKGKTDKLAVKKAVDNSKHNDKNEAVHTEALAQSDETEVLADNNATEVLENSGNTTVLNEEVTTVLYGGDSLMEEYAEEIGTTKTLEFKDMPEPSNNCDAVVDYCIETDIKFTHTNEIIE